MTGKNIPMSTWHRITRNGIETFKKPQYELKTAAEEKAHQDKLGDSIRFYYGLSCNKCCGVYPKFLTDNSPKDLCYYICMVCGKESVHECMTHLAITSWNEGRYKWEPPQKRQLATPERKRRMTKKEKVMEGQMSLFDFFGKPDYKGSRDEIVRSDIEAKFTLQMKTKDCTCGAEPVQMCESCKEYFVKCPECNRQTKTHRYMYEAIQAWNWGKTLDKDTRKTGKKTRKVKQNVKERREVHPILNDG